MKTHIICDIDGTIANCDHRVDLAQAGLWDDFHAKCPDDKPYHDVITVMRLLTMHPGISIIGLTGRSEKNRIQTLKWMEPLPFQFDTLLMRPDDDYTKDVELKIRLLEEHFGSKAAVLNSVLCVFDDRDRVVAGLRDYGLTVFQPREGAY